MKSWNGHHGQVLLTQKGFEVIECRDCGFIHMAPIPSHEELAKYYADHFVQDRPDYLQRFREDLDWWRIIYADKYDMFEEHLGRPDSRIIDIGCGLGFFLEEGKKRGWQTLGIEPSKPAAAHAESLGLELINDTFGAHNASSLGQFDVVHMHEVLEHLPDPKQLLTLALDLLVPGGLVCVVVPNDFNPLQRLLQDHFDYRPWWVSPPVHVNYFNFRSLEKLMTSLGLEVVDEMATFPLELFLLMGDDYVGNDALGRVCHRKRAQLELNLKAAGQDQNRRKIYRELARYGIGREALILARKGTGVDQ